MFGLFDDIAHTSIAVDEATTLRLLHSPADPEATRGVVLLVHGFTGSKEDFILVLSDLAKAGFDAWAPDLRGVYESQSAGPYDLDTLAGDLLLVARQIARHSRPVHLVGHSFGGLVAERAVVAAPDLFASLTLMCSGPAGFTHSADLNPNSITRTALFKSKIEGHTLEEAWQAKVEFENVDIHPAMAGFLRERFVTSSHEAVLAQVDAVVNADDVIDAVAASGVPGFVMYGAGDGTWAQQVQNATAVRLGTQPVVIPDAVHNLALENPDDTTAALLGFYRGS